VYSWVKFKLNKNENNIMGKNWNSRTGQFEEIKSQEIRDLAEKAKKLKAKGYSVSEIAEKFGLSKGRIYEYLK